MLLIDVDADNLPSADPDILAILTKPLNVQRDILRCLLLGVAKELVIALLYSALGLGCKPLVSLLGMSLCRG